MSLFFISTPSIKKNQLIQPKWDKHFIDLKSW
jgi:hypothetical protein